MAQVKASAPASRLENVAEAIRLSGGTPHVAKKTVEGVGIEE